MEESKGKHLHVTPIKSMLNNDLNLYLQMIKIFKF